MAILYSKRLLSPINMRSPSTYWKSQQKEEKNYVQILYSLEIINLYIHPFHSLGIIFIFVRKTHTLGWELDEVLLWEMISNVEKGVSRDEMCLDPTINILLSFNSKFWILNYRSMLAEISQGFSSDSVHVNLKHTIKINSFRQLLYRYHSPFFLSIPSLIRA